MRGRSACARVLDAAARPAGICATSMPSYVGNSAAGETREAAVDSAPAPKRGRGQPPKGELARNRVIAIRVTEDEGAAIDSAAAADDVTTANWIRERALEALGEDPVELDRAELAELRRRVQELEAWRARVRGKVEDLADLDAALERTLAARGVWAWTRRTATRCRLQRLFWGATSRKSLARSPSSSGSRSSRGGCGLSTPSTRIRMCSKSFGR